MSREFDEIASIIKDFTNKFADVPGAIKQLESQYAGISGDIDRKLKAVRAQSWSGGSYRGVFETENEARAFGALMLSQARGTPEVEKFAARCTEILKRDFKDVYQRAMDSVTDSALISPEASKRITRLVEQFGTFERNAFIMPMGQSDSLTFIRRTGGLTVFRVGENVAGTASQPTHANVTLNAIEYGTLTYVPRTLQEDSIAVFGELIAMEVATAMSEKTDEIGWSGTGDAASFGVVGVCARLLAINSAAPTTGGLVLGSGNLWSELTLGDHDKVMGALPDYASADAQWFVSRPYFFNVMVRLMHSAGGLSAAEIEGQRRLMFNGSPVVICQKGLPKTEANGQVCALYGSLRQAATVGRRRDVTVESSMDYKFAERQITYLGTQRKAISVHDVGTAAVAGPICGLITASS